MLNLAGDPGTLGFGLTSQINNANGVVISSGLCTAIQNFQLGLASSFSITPQKRLSPKSTVTLLARSLMDTFRYDVKQVLIEAGFRFEWLVYRPSGIIRPLSSIRSRSLSQVRTNGYDQPYKQNYNYMPRLGFIYDVFGNNKTCCVAAILFLSDQPLSGLVTGLAATLRLRRR